MFSCPTICSSICIHIVQVLWDFAGLPAMVCACCVPTGLWLLLTTRHIPPSSSGKLLKTARRKQINCRHCLFLAIRPASPHPNTNKGEKPKTKEGRNGRTPRNRRIPDVPPPSILIRLLAPFVCPANLIRAPHGTLVLDLITGCVVMAGHPVLLLFHEFRR